MVNNLSEMVAIMWILPDQDGWDMLLEIEIALLNEFQVTYLVKVTWKMAFHMLNYEYTNLTMLERGSHIINYQLINSKFSPIETHDIMSLQ